MPSSAAPASTLNQQKTVRIIGAGPAGLFAAEQIAAAGHKVILHDRMQTPGRKFLMAGRGGLNLTHSEPLDRFLSRYTAMPALLYETIAAYPPEALRQWADGRGAKTFAGSSGRIFPRAMKSSPLLRAWLAKLASLGVELRTGERLKQIGSAGLIFSSKSGDIDVPHADALLLACGGASWPGLGSDGQWTDLLKTAGVETRAFQPSNMGFLITWTERFRKEQSGKPLKSAAFSHESQRQRGEAVVTETGIEGGAIYALSASMRQSLLANGKTILTIDLKPDLEESEIVRRLSNAQNGESLASTLRKGLNLDPLHIALLHEQALLQGSVLVREPKALARAVKSAVFPVSGMQGLERAISSAGGLPFNELNPDFSLKRMPGVFAAGEMLDWEAPTGGYLLQGCFATGHAAAQGILRFLDQRRSQ